MFERFASWVDAQTAKSTTFAIACCVIVAWALSGPYFGFSDTWQLVINTGTTIVTFLMVFLLQNSQTRQTQRHYQLTQKIERIEERILGDVEREPPPEPGKKRRELTWKDIGKG